MLQDEGLEEVTQRCIVSSLDLLASPDHWIGGGNLKRGGSQGCTECAPNLGDELGPAIRDNVGGIAMAKYMGNQEVGGHPGRM